MNLNRFVCLLFVYVAPIAISCTGRAADNGDEDDGAGGDNGDNEGGAGGEDSGGTAGGGEPGGSNAGAGAGGQASLGGNAAGGSGGTGGRGNATGGSAGSANVGGAGGSSTKGGNNQGGSNAGGTSAGGAGGMPAGGAGGMATGGAGGAMQGALLPDRGVKLAFTGDTGDGKNYQAVANLIKNEKGVVVIAGDMTYSSNPPLWWSSTETVLGNAYPVFLARGNHDDSSWDGFLPKATNHLDGAQRIAGPHSAAYKTVYKGVSLVAIRKGDTEATIRQLFANDNHLWKVCYWHQNMATMQVGAKTDEMGWNVYEACRELGAIVITAHEHSYSRTRTLTNMASQKVDATCNGIDKLCVGRGRTYVTVTGLGGNSVRGQERCLPAAPQPPHPSLNTSNASCPMWGSIYTANQGATYGALIIEFNPDGDARKAHGIFKSVQGKIIDDYVVTHD